MILLGTSPSKLLTLIKVSRTIKELGSPPPRKVQFPLPPKVHHTEFSFGGLRAANPKYCLNLNYYLKPILYFWSLTSSQVIFSTYGLMKYELNTIWAFLLVTVRVLLHKTSEDNIACLHSPRSEEILELNGILYSETKGWIGISI